MISLRKWLIRMITGTSTDAVAYDFDYDEDDDGDKEKEEKKYIKERLQAIQEVSQTVQNTIGYLASLGESTKNTFNFFVPELTWLAVVLLLGAIVVLHYVPVRLILLFWGIMKFSRRILRPNTIPNNDLLDFLSRVPDDEAINQFRELPPSAISFNANAGDAGTDVGSSITASSIALPQQVVTISSRSLKNVSTMN